MASCATDSGTPRNRQTAAALASGFDQHGIRMTMVGAGETDDAGPAGDGARHAHRRHHRFGAGIGEGDPFAAGQVPHQLRSLADQRAFRPDLDTLFELGRQGLLDQIRVVAEQTGTEGHGQVDQLVTVQIVNPGTGGGIDHQRENHFFGGLAKASELR